ncbi:Na/Pi cotransporter family protein [bacterium]|nr:Na/Pi cotransporter family protein [bacterium]MBR1618525.1 Na/Pi cotransporter family protein [bacterium]
MDIFSIFTLMGGLAFFLYGMIIMSSGLEKIAGGKMEKLLEQLTSNPFKGFLVGAGMTIAIQSSSAVTVMLVGFVNSGIMKLSQTVAIIIGSNVGTTVTSWILSLSGIQSTNFFLRMLKPESFSPLLALAGVIMLMTSRSNFSRRKPVGTFLIGFSILMFGMGLMSSSMAPLANDPNFSHILTLFKNPFLGLMVGLVITMIIQSSAASVGMLQALSLTGSISYMVAAPIIAGQHIGTCITAVLSSIGVNTNAKRVAAVHVAFNVIGAIIFLAIFEIWLHTFEYPLKQMANPFGIAIVHTVFSILAACCLFPFRKALEKISYIVVKDSKEEKEVILDERLLLTPSIAISQCYKTTAEMAKLTRESLVMSVRQLKQYNPKISEIIEKNESKIDKYQDVLESFLQKLSAKDLTEDDSNKISQLILSISDFEKIADHSTHIMQIADQMHRKEWVLASDTVEELKKVVNAVKEVFDITVKAFIYNDLRTAYEVEPFEQVVDDISYVAKKNHIKRVKREKVHIRRNFAYAEVLNDLERISDHCSNISTNMIQSANSSIPKHELKKSLKEEDVTGISQQLEEFKKQYSLQLME